eukprot:NODE_27142_length_524_cov_2.264484.p1 GENE.NODE_27142_length_524_cov_2.264484~~NODE_27142_length_524_cov_2.264484.p1  ORF type:complete len:147 (-),score=7.98 NODE_27142_length_524_cov_2.264484:56-496(-)
MVIFIFVGGGHPAAGPRAIAASIGISALCMLLPQLQGGGFSGAGWWWPGGDAGAGFYDVHSYSASGYTDNGNYGSRTAGHDGTHSNGRHCSFRFSLAMPGDELRAYMPSAILRRDRASGGHARTGLRRAQTHTAALCTGAGSSRTG